MSWSGPILGDVAVLCLRNDDFGKCNGIISYLFNEHNSIIGMLEPDQINELFDACVLNCHIESAMVSFHSNLNINNNFHSILHGKQITKKFINCFFILPEFGALLLERRL